MDDDGRCSQCKLSFGYGGYWLLLSRDVGQLAMKDSSIWLLRGGSVGLTCAPHFGWVVAWIMDG